MPNARRAAHRRVMQGNSVGDLGERLGTFAYAAPEVLCGSHACATPADIYSFGVLLAELITGVRQGRSWRWRPRPMAAAYFAPCVSGLAVLCTTFIFTYT